jgi:Tfp pilus assembly protein PilF
MDEQEIHELTERALDALRRGDDVRAVAIADQLIAAVPDDAVAHAVRAQGLLSSENTKEALEEARRAVELDGENQNAHRLLGLAAWRAERLSLAQESLERAIELSGRRPEFLSEYAWFMASERGPRPAQLAAREAVEADAESSTAWAALGMAQLRLHRRDDAEVSLRRALKLDPNDLYARAAMLTLLQEQHQDGKAEALADLLSDEPHAEEFVAQVRDEAKQRKIAQMLVERDAMPEARQTDAPRRLATWFMLVVLLIAGLVLLLRPPGVFGFVVFLTFLLLFLWYVRRIVG